MNIINFLNYIRINDIVDIIFVAIITYYIFKLISGTRAEQLIKGILIILVLLKTSELLHLYTVNWLLNYLMKWGIVALLIIFQPELRRGLEFIGRSGFVRNIGINKKEASNSVTEIINAIASLSRQRIGALIIIERETGLNEIVETGTLVDGLISSGLLINIFIPNTPLHDGAVIIKGDIIRAAACFLPLSDSPNIAKELGTRHRAGIGITEKSDCISIIISEETGAISTAESGVISRHLDLLTLEKNLDKIYYESKNETNIFIEKWRKFNEEFFNKFKK